MGEGALVVEAVGHCQVFGVVGDGDVFVAAGEGGFGHLADGVAAVGGDGVHVEVAADVGLGDEVGQACVRGRPRFLLQFSRSSGGIQSMPRAA